MSPRPRQKGDWPSAAFPSSVAVAKRCEKEGIKIWNISKYLYLNFILSNNAKISVFLVKIADKKKKVVTDSLSNRTHRKFSDWYVLKTNIHTRTQRQYAGMLRRKKITKREENEQTNNRERQKVRAHWQHFGCFPAQTETGGWIIHLFHINKSLEDLANQMSAEIGRKFLLPQHAWQAIILPLIAWASVFQWWSLINDAFHVISPLDWLAGWLP